MVFSRHRRTILALVCGALSGLALAACSSGPSHSSSAARRATGTLVESAPSADYGTILVTSTGMTLYMNSGDSPTTSVCTGACPAVWPPLTTKGRPRAGPGVEASLLGTFTRPDGSTQVTYAGHPLYTFVHDTAAGQVNGEGIVHFGGTWYVLDTAGHPVTGALSSTTSTSPPTTAAAPATPGSTAPSTTAASHPATSAPPPSTTSSLPPTTTTSLPPTTTTTAPPSTTTTTYSYYP